MTKRFPLSCVSLAVLHAFNTASQAASIQVDGTECTLVEAIVTANNDAAEEGCNVSGNFSSDYDFVVLEANSVHALTVGYGGGGSTGLPFISSSIKLYGYDSIIKRDPNAISNFRLAAVTGSGKFRMSDVTLQGGELTANGAGGALYIGTNSSAQLNNVTIDSNRDSATGGSAAVNNKGLLSLRNSQISNNAGSGILNQSTGTLRIENSDVNSNTATRGAGLYNSGYASIRDSRILSNYANVSGGGLRTTSGSSTTLMNSEVDNNAAALNGGGVYTNGWLSLGSSSVSDNQAIGGASISIESGRGGAIYAGQASTVSMFTTNINNNEAGEQGAGIFSQGNGSVTVNIGSTLIGNITNASSGFMGGAVSAIDSSIVNIFESTVNENSSRNGGAIAVQNSARVSLIKSTLSNNSASLAGGAVFTTGNSVLGIQESTIANSSASTTGGAIHAAGNGSHQFTDATLKNNSSGSHGGALFSTNNNFTSNIYSVVHNNSATISGGGISANAGIVSLRNSTISGNEAPYGGGIFLGNTGTALVTNATVSANSATQQGGGIASDFSGILEIANSLVSGNESNLGSELNVDGTVESTSNLFANASKTNTAAIGGFQPSPTDINASVDGDAISFHKPTPLASIISALNDYGGPTLSHALIAGSPAIDAGNNLNCSAKDQRGVDRSDGLCDIGAFEGSVPGPSSCYVVKAANGKVLTFCL